MRVWDREGETCRGNGGGRYGRGGVSAAVVGDRGWVDVAGQTKSSATDKGEEVGGQRETARTKSGGEGGGKGAGKGNISST